METDIETPPLHAITTHPKGPDSPQTEFNPQATAPSPPLSQQTPPAIDEIVHRVVPGDTLWDIAARYLDDPFQYPELARLSQISNPDLIYPGDIIHIIRKKR